MNERKCRKLVYGRSEQLCDRCCRGSGSLTVHHRKKRSQGGLWTPDNCVLLCGHGTAGCHGWVEHNPDAACAEGFHVRPWQQPSQIPVLWRGNQWIYLLENGESLHV